MTTRMQRSRGVRPARLGGLRFAAIVVSLLIAPTAAMLAERTAGQRTAAPAAAAPPSGGPELIIRNPDSVFTGPINSFVGSQPFVVEVKAPGSGPEVTVTFTTASGTTRTLTIPETGPGSGSYVSQPITADGGAQKTGDFERHFPGNLSRAMDGLNADDGEGVSVTIAGTAAASSFRVYKTNISQATGEYKLAFARARARSVDGKVAATKLLQRKNLKPAQVSSLQNSIRIFDARIALIDRTTTLIANPPARTGIGDYVGTEWWELGIYTTNWQLLNLRDPANASPDDISNAQSIGRNIAEKARTEANNFLVKSLALGLYNAATSATMSGPLYTAITGKNIYGKDASAEEIEAAISALAQFAAGMVVVPVAIDAVAGAAADELSGRGSGPPTPAGPQPTGVQSRNLPEGNPVFMNDQRLAAARLDVASRGFQALSQGVLSPEALMSMLDATFKAAQDAVESGRPEEARTILNDANLQIADSMFRARYPDAPPLVTDPSAINLVNSVKTKAALEAQGKAQTWTKAEIGKLHELNADPNVAKIWEFEDPGDLLLGRDASNGQTDPFDPGYRPLVTAEDISNISNAAGKALTMGEDTPAVPKAQRPVRTTAPAPANPTQTGGRTPVGQDLGTPINAKGAGQFDMVGISIDQLKMEIIAKRKYVNRKIVTGAQAPVSGERVATGGKPETDVVTGKNIDALTQQEISKFTPDDIKNLPAKVREQLPLNKLSARQLQALADSGIAFPNDQIKSLTPETIARMPAELRDLLPVDELSGDQLKALANSMGLPTAGPSTTGLGPMSGAASAGTGAGKNPPVDTGGLRPEDERRAAAAVLGDPIPDTKTNGEIGMATPTGTLLISPNGTLALTPFSGSPTYPGLFGPNGGIQLFSPGTALTTGATNVPIYFVNPTPLPLSGLTTGADGAVTYSGLSGLALTPGPKTDGSSNSLLAGGDGAGGNVVGGGLAPVPMPPDGPLFGFSDYDTSDPTVHLTLPFSETTTPVDVDDGLGGGFVAGRVVPLTALSFERGPADTGVQAFIAIITVQSVPAWDVGTPMASWLSPQRWWRALGAIFDGRPGLRATETTTATALGRGPRTTSSDRGDLAPQAGTPNQSKGLKAVFVSRGTATGDAFEANILNDTGGPVSLNGDGVVLESIGKDSQDKVRKQIQDAVKAHRGKPPATAAITGYCLEYLKPPPIAGGLFRVAAPEVQAKFAALRKVLQAEEQLEKLGKLVPDVDPKTYFDQLRQWALWSKAQGFTPETFAKAFVDHAKANFTAAKQPWTKAVESQVAGLVPHRWQDIATVLQEAASRVGK